MKYLHRCGLSAVLMAAGLSATYVAAKPSVNDMSACQATAEFVAQKLQDIPASKYDAADRAALKLAVTGYAEFLQDKHIAPGLLEFNGGDKAKADAMQKQVSNYQKTLTAAMEQKYSGERLYSDQAIMLDNCYSKAPMDESFKQNMIDGLQAMIKMAMQK